MTTNKQRKQEYNEKEELKNQRVEQWETQVNRLRSLVEKAVSVLESDLDNSNDPRLRQAAAIHVLRAVKLYGEVDKPEDEYIPKFRI